MKLRIAFGVAALVGLTGAYVPQPSPGTYFHLISANSDNATSIKASTGVVYAASVSNTSGTVVWLKLYDTASAPGCATATVAASWIVPADGPQPVSLPVGPFGLNFLSGIGMCLVTGSLDNDDSRAPAGIVINIEWN